MSAHQSQYRTVNQKGLPFISHSLLFPWRPWRLGGSTPSRSLCFTGNAKHIKVKVATDETQMKHGLKNTGFIRVQSVFHPWLKRTFPHVGGGQKSLFK